MFSHLAKKLKSKRGGAMVVSMIYFLFAAVLGSFVVISTQGNTYRLTRLREEAQSYHGAKSALNLVTNMFNKMSYTFELWERRTWNDEGAELLYFMESIYPYPVQYTTLQEAFNGKPNSPNKGKTYPIGKFKINGDNNKSIEKFFYGLFSNHTMTGSDIPTGTGNSKSWAVGNELANMFVTTEGTYEAFKDKVFPTVPDDKLQVNKDNDMKAIMYRFMQIYPVFMKKYQGKDIDARGIEDSYKLDEFGNRESFKDLLYSVKYNQNNNSIDEFEIEYYKSNGVGGQSNNHSITEPNVEGKTMQELILKNAGGHINTGVNPNLETSLQNIYKSSAGVNEYKFKIEPQKNNTNVEFKPYYVTIKFLSDNKKSIGTTVTADDLFVAVVEIRENENDQEPLFTATSKCTVTATRNKLSEINSGGTTTQANGGATANTFTDPMIAKRHCLQLQASAQ